MSTWFRDAKFGIWSHWGPQSVPRRGDWYARRLYLQRREPEPHEVGPTSRRLFHEWRYGHPSRVGHKDICARWKAERWDPDALMDRYVQAGARYFMALANHIDNVDLWDSSLQPWNAARVGPRRDILDGWTRAARRRGLPVGLSFHANWAWQLLDVAFGADDDGPYAGQPYDGMLTTADGTGTWWEGLNPRALYGPPRTNETPPNAAFVDRFYRRMADAWARYRPQLVYLDDSRLPFDDGSVCETSPASTAGREVVARMRERSRQWYGDDGATLTTIKRVTDGDPVGTTLDVERQLLSGQRAHPWQMDTCLGHWFYDDNAEYKSARQVIHMLVDVVSKNGNLLLSVPQRPDGTIDDQEIAILDEVGAWLRRHGEAIYETRPWTVAGEGPTTGDADRFAEADLPYTGEDIRFTTKGDVLYATLLGRPCDSVARIVSLGRRAGLLDHEPSRVEMLGVDGPLEWERGERCMDVRLPPGADWHHAETLRIVLA